MAHLFVSMRDQTRQLTADIIAIQLGSDGRYEPKVLSSGQVLRVQGAPDSDGLNEVSLRGASYLVGAASLRERSVCICSEVCLSNQLDLDFGAGDENRTRNQQLGRL
jgi:hypothetical protein